jgi:hypothetical protein
VGKPGGHAELEGRSRACAVLLLRCLLLAVRRAIAISFRYVGDEMSSFRRPKRRVWGWLVAIAYLLGSITPSLAAAFPASPMELSIQCSHEVHEFAGSRQHGLASAVLVDVATSESNHADQDRHSNRHAGCCDSAPCFSAVSPQAPSLLHFSAPRCRCELEPALISDEGAFSRLYRPPNT